MGFDRDSATFTTGTNESVDARCRVHAPKPSRKDSPDLIIHFAEQHALPIQVGVDPIEGVCEELLAPQGPTLLMAFATRHERSLFVASMTWPFGVGVKLVGMLQVSQAGRPGQLSVQKADTFCGAAQLACRSLCWQPFAAA